MKLIVGVWERDRNNGLKDVDTYRGLLYWPFLNSHCDSIFGALCLCFLDQRFSTGVCCGPRPQTHCRWCPEQLTVTLCFSRDWPLVPVFIWFHNTYTFRLWFPWSISTCQPMPAVFLFTHLEHPVPKIPNWQLCQRSICNNCLDG